MKPAQWKQWACRRKLVPGSAQNFKVTYPEDFALAQAVLQARVRASSGDALNRLKQGYADYDYP
jgi:hypothetical protein